MIIKEIDSHDKFTRNSALDAWVQIYMLIGNKFWTMSGKSLNQKVKDLLDSKFAHVPKPKKQEKPTKEPEESKIKSIRGKKSDKKLVKPTQISDGSSSIQSSLLSSFKSNNDSTNEKQRSLRKSFSESVKAVKSRKAKKFTRVSIDSYKNVSFVLFNHYYRLSRLRNMNQNQTQF